MIFQRSISVFTNLHFRRAFDSIPSMVDGRASSRTRKALFLARTKRDRKNTRLETGLQIFRFIALSLFLKEVRDYSIRFFGSNCVRIVTFVQLESLNDLILCFQHIVGLNK